MVVKLDPQQRKAAIEMARQAKKGGWSEAALADVLAALGILSGKQAQRVAQTLHQNPDPHYVPVCPGGTHVAEGNVVRARDGHVRCRECAVEVKQRKIEREQQDVA